MEITPLSEQEVERFRKETNGTALRIHFNNAGASLPPDVVVDTVVRYLQEEASYGGYEVEDKYKQQLQHVYVSIARLINAAVDEVAIVESASVGWGVAFNGIAFAPGDEIITSEMEYVTNLLGFLNAQKKYGIVLRVVPGDTNGNFSLSALEQAINSRTRLIAITHIPSTSGNMLPIVEIGKIARKHQVLYLVDACQTVGQAPIDVTAIDCDILAVTGRKFLRAPRGTGFLYVRKTIQDQLTLQLLDGHTATLVSKEEFTIRADARRFELYEKNRALTLGLGKAIDYALEIGVDRIWQRVQELAGLMRRQLAGIPGVTVHDSGEPLCGIVTFSVAGKDAVTIKKQLSEATINVSVGKAVSTLLYMDRHHLTSVVRASVHYYNTGSEVDRMCGLVQVIS